jgi:hypothetical protein
MARQCSRPMFKMDPTSYSNKLPKNDRKIEATTLVVINNQGDTRRGEESEERTSGEPCTAYKNRD